MDIYHILKNGHAILTEIIELAAQKYAEAFDPRLFFEQLLYFDDLEDAPIEFIGKAVTKEDLQAFFADKIRQVPL